jgi:hypothetical protein
MFKRVMIYSAAAFAAAMMGVPIAAAQDVEPQVLNVTGCGPSISSQVRTENAPSTTNSVAFVLVPGAVAGFTVPAGRTQCVKVLFTAKAACRGRTTIGDFCYIRATINGVEMLPQGAGFRTFLSEDVTENAHAYQWVRRVGPGNQVVRLERRVGNVNTFFLLDDWTFDVQLYQ